MLQAAALAKNPHIIVATPGRLLHHLQKSSPINLRTVKYLVHTKQILVDLNSFCKLIELIALFRLWMKLIDC